MLLFLNIYHLLEGGTPTIAQVWGQGTDSWMLIFSWFPPLFHFIQPRIPIQSAFSLHSSSWKDPYRNAQKCVSQVTPQPVKLTSKGIPHEGFCQCLWRVLCKGHPCRRRLVRGARDARTHSVNSSEPATSSSPNLVPGKMKRHYFLPVDISMD